MVSGAATSPPGPILAAAATVNILVQKAEPGGQTCHIALIKRPISQRHTASLQYKTAHFASGCGTAHCTREAKDGAARYGKTWWHRAHRARSGPGQPQYAVTGRAHWPGKQKADGKAPHPLSLGPCRLLPQAVRPRWLSAFRFCRGPGVCRRECLPRLRCPPTGVSGRARCRPPSAVRRTAGGGCGLPGGARRCAHRPRGSRS